MEKQIALLLREKFHSERANYFLSTMQPKDGISILDLGGGSGDFLARIQNVVKGKYVIADIADNRNNHDFEFIKLIEGEALPFSNNEFDIVICNSVIEHVTLPKEACIAKTSQTEWALRSFTSQRIFANEIRRICKSYFIQTPHKSFPLETHTWLPFVNLLSHNLTNSLVKFTDQYWIKKCGIVDWNLLSQKEMNILFPEATIMVERFMGLPKSLIAYKLDK